MFYGKSFLQAEVQATDSHTYEVPKGFMLLGLSFRALLVALFLFVFLQNTVPFFLVLLLSFIAMFILRNPTIGVICNSDGLVFKYWHHRDIHVMWDNISELHINGQRGVSAVIKLIKKESLFLLNFQLNGLWAIKDGEVLLHTIIDRCDLEHSKTSFFGNMYYVRKGRD